MKAAKGDTVTFDSAVVVRLDKYRQIRLAIGDAPAVIDSLQTLLYEAENIAAMTELIDVSYREEIQELEKQIKLLEEKNESADSTIDEVTEIATEQPPKKGFFAKIKDGLIWLAGGILIGAAVSSG